MALMKAILHKVHSTIELNKQSNKKYPSPPPELDEETIDKPRKSIHKYAHIKPRVDSSPPNYDGTRSYRKLQPWTHDHNTLFNQNIQLLMTIKKAHWQGKLDCHWSSEPKRSRQYHRKRVDFLNEVYHKNQHIYKTIMTVAARVQPTASLQRDWCYNRQKIVNRALNPFVLFPPVPQEDLEDPAFATPVGVKRPRVYMTVGLHGCAVLGELCLELFSDVCPQTCQLFTELLDGDTVGHGYVGTCFFRKVPNLYWSGGDVTHNNGFGCYAQRGRVQPIGAENYHFPHSMPGLLSMRVTCDNECCGIFNITFKSLPQFDLHNVVFGRVIRPSLTYDTARVLGKALSSYPLVEIRSTRRQHEGRWLSGQANTRIANTVLHTTRQSLAQRRQKNRESWVPNAGLFLR